MWCILALLGIAVFVAFYIFYKLFEYALRKPFVGGIHSKYVLITGCSSGFGFDAVKRFDTMGCHVFAGVRDENAAEKIRTTCSSRVVPVFIDIAKPDSVQECYEEIVKLLPEDKGLWALVNNAGISSLVKGPTDWNSTEIYRRTLDVNVFGTIDTTLKFLPLIKRAQGRVVCVTSVLGTIYAPSYSAYCVSKRAVEAFTDTLRCEMSYFGIRTSIIEPGTFFTNINDFTKFKENAQKNIDSLSNDLKKQYGKAYMDRILYPRPHQQKLGSHDLTPVADAYAHAVFAVFSRARYVVGKGMKTIIFFHRILPEWIYDFLARMNAPVPAIATK